MKNTDLDEALSESALWPISGELARPVEIKGGLTNRSFLLKTDQSSYRLRLNTKLAFSLGIDREREEHIAGLVHAAGIGPELLFSGEAYQYSLFKFTKGRPWTAQDFRDKQQVARLQSIIKRFQRLNVHSTPRDYRKYLDHYWQQLEGLSCLSSEEIRQYLEFDALLEKRSEAWPKFVLCHHDLIPENIIETATGLVIIDWEYAALGHPDLDENCLASYEVASKHKKDIDPVLEELIFWLNRLWTELSERISK